MATQFSADFALMHGQKQPLSILGSLSVSANLSGRRSFDFFESFIALLAARYPETAKELDLKESFSPTIFCQDVVELPKELKTQAQMIVQAFWSLRNLPSRAQHLRNLEPKVVDPGNTSILMSYDFHVDQENNLRLIEINTNASMALMVDSLHLQQNEPNSFCSDFRSEIVASIRREFALAFPSGRPLERIAIIDEEPEKQKMLPEFHMYRELLKSEGFEVHIIDSKKLSFEDGALLLPSGKALDFVYNRDTDFYLNTPERSALRAAMLERAACFSPHPHEYRLLADKDRLLELSEQGALDSLPLTEQEKSVIASTLIRTVKVSDFKSEVDLWQQRKKWFFKPSRSYGGKAAYRGSSVGRTVFAQIVSNPYLAQEYIPAPTIRLASLPDSTDFKYDLRFFVYDDKIQIACARVYKGQMTNSQSPGGGVTVIRWV